jgi:hypothetical protein
MGNPTKKFTIWVNNDIDQQGTVINTVSFQDYRQQDNVFWTCDCKKMLNYTQVFRFSTVYKHFTEYLSKRFEDNKCINLD